MHAALPPRERPLRPLLRLALSAALIFVTLAALSIPLPARAQVALPGSFTPAECPIPIPEGLSADCGYLTVAESRQRAASTRTIRLAVATLRSPNPSKAADPALLLSGGPGQPALPLLPVVAAAYAPVLAQRDIVFIDQRGTGFSQPALNCASSEVTPTARTGGLLTLGAQPDQRPVVLQLQVAQLLECGRQLRAQGIDLSAYNTVENAADLEDLRRALGVSQWNLIGASYGTRLALTAMQYRPETIRSAVLDSVYPLEENFHTGAFASYNQALNGLFAACAADASCNAAYPQLDAAFDTVIARLNADAAQVPLRNLESGELITYLPVTGVDVSSIIFQLLYGTEAIPLLPRLISETAAGNYNLLSVLLSILLLQSQPGEVPLVSQGMQVAVQCNEDATFAKPRDFVAARDANRRASALAFISTFNEAYLEVCAAWGLRATNPAENAPVRSDVPALLIGGELDPITPVQNAYQQARNLSRSTVVIVPRGGHTPSFSSPCLAGAVAAFLANPGQGPDTRCLAATAPLPFALPG
jgi:pimeloyl-ACP methyl ester carboxylesterase